MSSARRFRVSDEADRGAFSPVAEQGAEHAHGVGISAGAGIILSIGDNDRPCGLLGQFHGDLNAFIRIIGLSLEVARYVYGFVLTALPLFLAGCAAGMWVMPHIVQLMTGFAPQFTASYLDASAYFDFVLKLTLITGVAFVLPVFVVLLNFAGVVSGRAIAQSWRWALIGICLFTAIATPAADVMSMLLLAAPMIALYLVACVVSLINDKRRRRQLDAVLQPVLTTRSQV